MHLSNVFWPPCKENHFLFNIDLIKKALWIELFHEPIKSLCALDLQVLLDSCQRVYNLNFECYERNESLQVLNQQSVISLAIALPTELHPHLDVKEY